MSISLKNHMLKLVLAFSLALPLASSVQVSSADAGNKNRRAAIIAGAIVGGAIVYHGHRKYRKNRHYNNYGHTRYYGHKRYKRSTYNYHYQKHRQYQRKRYGYGNHYNSGNTSHLK